FRGVLLRVEKIGFKAVEGFDANADPEVLSMARCFPETFYGPIPLLRSSPYACHYPKGRMQRSADQLCAEFRRTTHAFFNELNSLSTHVAIGTYEVCVAR